MARDDSATVVQGNTVIIPVLDNDDGDALSVQNVRRARGVVRIQDDGTLLYRPTPNFVGEDIFEYTVTNSRKGRASAQVRVRVRVAQANLDPVAKGDTATTDEDTPVTIDVLANDSDPDGDALSVASVTPGTSGSVAINLDSTVTYTPDENFNGSDSFTYTVSDGNGGEATAGVTIIVNTVNDDPVAVDDAYSVAEDNTLTVNAAAGILDNDSDVDGDPLTAALLGDGTANGSLTLNADGSFTYTPEDGYFGSDGFDYTVSDDNGGTATASVSLSVGSVNDSPVANAQSVTTDEDLARDITLTGSDPDANVLTFAITAYPSHGSLSGTAPNLTYLPEADFNGADSFTFTVNDGYVNSAAATVTITVNPVNDAPVAIDDIAGTQEDVAVIIEVLANDYDVDDGDLLTVQNVRQAQSKGKILIDKENGTLLYTPSPNFSGTDVFYYTIYDVDGLTDEGMVTMTVGGVNDAPVAYDAAFDTQEEVAFSDTLPAFDADGDDLTYSIVDQGTKGTAIITDATTNEFTYTPDPDANGQDSFTFRIYDGAAYSTEATVTINIEPVNDAPIITSSPVTAATEGVAYVYDITADDADAGAVLSISAATKPTWLDFTDNGDGTALLSGTPDNADVGDHDVVLAVTDGVIATPVTQSFTITVSNVNDAPVFTSRPVTSATEEVAYVSDISASDDDAGAVLTISAATKPTWLDFTDNGDGTALLSGTPDNVDVGDHDVVLAVTDGVIATPVTQSFTITVSNVNDAPVFTSRPVTSATEGVAYVYDITADDDDAGAILTIAIMDKPKWLTFTDGGGGTATLTGTPGNADVGNHAVVLALTDGVIAPDYGGPKSPSPWNNITPVTQSFIIKVSNVNDAPVFTSSPVTSATEGVAYVYDITADDADAGAILSISAATKPTWLDFTDNGDGTALLTGTPGNGDVGDHTVVLALTDGVIAAPVEQTFTITVSNVNEDPVAVDDEASTDENSPVIINVLENDVDADVGDVLSVASVAYPAHGTVQNNQDGTITYTPDTGFSGSDSFTYTVSDNNGGSATATVTVLVNLEGDLAADVPVDPDAGGTVTTDIGISVEIPGGSLSEAVNIQIGTYDEVPPGAPELAGILYFFGPSGTTFDPPATITVPYNPDRLPPGFDPEGLVLLIYSEIDGTWEEALNSTVNTGAQTVSGQTYHFSGFAAGLLLDRAPQLIMSLPEPVIEEDAQSTVIIENLAEYFADPNFGDQIDFDVTSPDEGLHALYVTDESALIVDPKPNFYGDIRIVITATDQTGLSVSDTLFLTVTQDNDPPLFPPGFRELLAEFMTINEDQVLRIPLMADDVEGDDVTFHAASDTSAVTTLVQDTTLLVVPIQDWFGTAHIIISASDGQDTTHLDPLTLTIEAVNDPPSAFELLTPDIAAVIQVQPNNLGDSLTFAWAESIDPDRDQVRYAFMLTDSGAFYFEYGDTTVNEVRVPYADILAAIRGQELTSATFWWTIMAISGQDTIEASDGPYSLTIDISTLAVADPSQLPQLFVLHQNYPNPFNPVTTLKYELPAYCRALLVIYDMRGREVTRLVDGYMGAGYNKVVWNSSDASGRPVPSGIYFARLVTSEYTHIIKMSLIR